MNYKKIYDTIIERAKLRGLNKKLLKGYFECHHIIPRSLGGTNDKSNLVLLTAREHYLCHHLLWKIHKTTSTFYAFNMMLVKSKNHKSSRIFSFTSIQYEIHKSILALLQSNKKKVKSFLLSI